MLTTTRDPRRTRSALLEAAYAEIHDVGFRAASIDKILSATGVTKGALYHHFKNKNELGYAVVDELIYGHIDEIWVQPLSRDGDAVSVIIDAVQGAIRWATAEGTLAKGCPLNNLAQEMSPIDEGFRSRIEACFARWQDAFAEVLRRGQDDGTIRADIDPEQMGLYILATLEGLQGLIKNRPDPDIISGQFRLFQSFVHSLRPNIAQVA